MNKYEYDNEHFFECVKCALFRVVFCSKIHEILFLFYINEINKRYGNSRVFRDEFSIKIHKI